VVDECSGSSVNARRRISAAQKKRSARSMVTRQEERVGLFISIEGPCTERRN